MQHLAGFIRQELFDWLIARKYLPFRINSDAQLASIKELEDGTLIVFRQVSQIPALN
jgi:hypothetical protein